MKINYRKENIISARFRDQEQLYQRLEYSHLINKKIKIKLFFLILKHNICMQIKL